MPVTRRHVALSLLTGIATTPFLIGVAQAQGRSQSLVPTPSCTDDDEPTPAQTEGPYFTPNSPQRHDLNGDGNGGDPILLAGHVLDTACRPLSGVMIELWHADASGAYDNEGFRYRGHGFSDAQGRWWFDTVIPGLYPGRTRHYHFKVQPPGASILTTQLYFPGEPQNSRDGIFDPALLLRVGRSSGDGERHGLFDFVLA